MRWRTTWTAFLVVASVSLMTANAAIIVDNTITGSITNDFNSLPSGNDPDFISQTGATYGESFDGQSLATGSGFDVLTGTPSSPLTLRANPTLNDNIGVVNDGLKQIYGDLGGKVGEGALSILFDSATNVLGMDVVGTAGSGAFTVQFFALDGSSLGTITQSVTNSFFGFRTTDGEQIRGVSITNTDPNGIAYDNVTFNDISAVPEPASIMLWGIGVAGFVAWRRKRGQIA